jgi:hypothetical protein
MKTLALQSAVIFFTLYSITVSATTHYVDLNCTNPVAPYTNWTTAATNIQDAVNAAVGFGDTVLVTNGVYRFGGAVHSGQTLSNRVSVPFGAGVKIQSVNGPAVTVIEGHQVSGTTNGPGAVRCVFLTEFSTLSGFTVTNGATLTHLAGVTQNSGGGVIAESNCTISNCVIVGNACSFEGGGTYTINGSTVINCIISGNVALEGGSGGGVYGNTVFNCVISNNVAANGGGVANCTVNNSLLTGNGNTNSVGGTSGGAAYFSTLNNCTLVGNFSRGLGAADGCTLRNSIIYYNVNGSYADCYQCQLANCCTTLGLGTVSLPSNCISNAPMFVDLAGGNLRLLPWSPCVNAGTNAYAPSGLDLDGNPRIVGGAVDMGAYENQNTNLIHYVSVGNTTPVSPFTNWITAATNIQDAIDVAITGEFIVVSNGIYDTGARLVYGAATNRVVVDKAVTVQSVNGPTATTIAGFDSPASNPSHFIRCVYLTNGASLIGFTLANGGSHGSGDIIAEQSGGGAWCESPSATISNCILSGNFAVQYGGGAYNGTLIGCILTNNTASRGGGAFSNLLINCTLIKNIATEGGTLIAGGGAMSSTLSNCLVVANRATAGGGGAALSALIGCIVSNNAAGYGGGVCFGTIYNSIISSNRASGSGGGGAYSNVLNNCVVKNNFASANGGGAYVSTLTGCVVSNNSANSGGGAYGGTMTNCLVVRNAATTEGGGVWTGNSDRVYNCTIVSNTAGSSGGVREGICVNSIIYFNIGGIYPNGHPLNVANCCMTPLQAGTGNITNEPLFVDPSSGNFHLQSNSPCINAGKNTAITATSDLGGNPRIAGGTVDIGAYEFQSPTSILSYVWAQQFGLPTDGSADFTDTDSDGLNNWQEWIAGTVPTNSASVLLMGSPSNTASGVTITWQSVSGKNYFLQRASDLAALPAFSALQSNIVGQAGTTTYTDTTATNGGPYFYRVGVQ